MIYRNAHYRNGHYDNKNNNYFHNHKMFVVLDLRLVFSLISLDKMAVETS